MRHPLNYDILQHMSTIWCSNISK